MTPKDFTHWLDGALNTGSPKSIGPKETQIIKDHLALVFNKVTPNRNGPSVTTGIDIQHTGEMQYMESNPFFPSNNTPFISMMGNGDHPVSC